MPLLEEFTAVNNAVAVLRSQLSKPAAATPLLTALNFLACQYCRGCQMGCWHGAHHAWRGNWCYVMMPTCRSFMM